MPEIALSFALRHGLQSTVLLDTDGEVGLLYRLCGTPTTFFVNSQGVIEDIRFGSITQEWIAEKL